MNVFGSLNFYRAAGDLLHLISICLLIWKINKVKSCVGVSCKMQEMYLIVFCSRYLNMFWVEAPVYNTVMKVIYMASTSYLIYVMRKKQPICATYDPKADSLNYLLYCVPPCALLAILTTKNYNPVIILWTFSIWFESVAILPQLFLLQKLREVENLTSNYVACMGLYRAMYILNWILRYYSPTDKFVCYVSWAGGAIQTALYLDFFYYYALSKWYGQKMVLPFVGQDVK